MTERSVLLAAILSALLSGPVPCCTEERDMDQARAGILTSAAEVVALPALGPEWENLLRYAHEDTSSPDLSDQDDPTNVRVLAKALVFVRTGAFAYRRDVVLAIRKVMRSRLDETLALGRELGAYVVAADLVGLEPADERDFRSFLERVVSTELDGRNDITTLVDSAVRDPSNWGCHARGSMVATAIYLGDDALLDRLAARTHDWLGRDGSGFLFEDLSWQCDPARPSGINPASCTRSGRNLDGVLPDDQRRGGEFDASGPFPAVNYVWECLQGTSAAILYLHRAGYTGLLEVEDQAFRRAFDWLHEEAAFPAAGDDEFVPHIANYLYNEDYPAVAGARPGKNLGFTDWLFVNGPVAPRPRARERE